MNLQAHGGFINKHWIKLFGISMNTSRVIMIYKKSREIKKC